MQKTREKRIGIQGENVKQLSLLTCNVLVSARLGSSSDYAEF